MLGKWSHSLRKLALCLGLLLCMAILAGHNAARADLINATINTDVPLKFEGTVDDTKLSFGNAVFKGGPKNWFVHVQQGNFDQDPRNAQNDIKAVVRHLVGPHAGEGPNPDAIVAYLFNVTPGGGAGPVTKGVLHGKHQDVLVLDYKALPAGGGSRLTLTANHSEVHAPEPSTLLLGLGGTAVLAAGVLARRKRRAVAE